MTAAINFLVWLIVSGIIGWMLSIVLRSNARQGRPLNIVVGLVGAIAAGLVLTPFVGLTTLNPNRFSLPALLVSLMGASILLAFVCLVRRDRRRR